MVFLVQLQGDRLVPDIMNMKGVPNFLRLLSDKVPWMAWSLRKFQAMTTIQIELTSNAASRHASITPI